MVTYTRCMDSILCVPLMIDAAVWCDYFARVGVPQDQVRTTRRSVVRDTLQMYAYTTDY